MFYDWWHWQTHLQPGPSWGYGALLDPSVYRWIAAPARSSASCLCHETPQHGRTLARHHFYTTSPVVHGLKEIYPASAIIGPSPSLLCSYWWRWFIVLHSALMP